MCLAESVPRLPTCLPACRPLPACLPARLLPCLAWGFLALLISHLRCLARATCAAQVPFQTSRWLQYKYWIPFRHSFPQLFYSCNPCLKQLASHESCSASSHWSCQLRRLLGIAGASFRPNAQCRPEYRHRGALLLVFLLFFLGVLLLLVAAAPVRLLLLCLSTSLRPVSPRIVFRFVSPRRLSRCACHLRASGRASVLPILCPCLPVCATLVSLLLFLPSVTSGPSLPPSSPPSPDARSISSSLQSPSVSVCSCACLCSLLVSHAACFVCV